MRFQSGDQVRVIRTHTLAGLPYLNECRVGDVGTVIGYERDEGLPEGIVRVEWPKDHWANDDWYRMTSCLDEKCLELLPLVTDEEVSAAIASITETAVRLQKREVTSIQNEAQGGRDEQATTE